MKKKNTLKKSSPLSIAIGVLAVLILFVLIVEKPGSQSLQKIQEGQPLVFSRLHLESVTHVTLEPGGKAPLKIEFRLSETGWMEGEKAMEGATMDRFLNAVHTIRKEALVSNNPSKQSLFQVDQASGIRVQIWKNSKLLADFWIGKQVGEKSQYLRLEGGNEVWQVTPLILPPLPALAEEPR